MTINIRPEQLNTLLVRLGPLRQRRLWKLLASQPCVDGDVVSTRVTGGRLLLAGVAWLLSTRTRLEADQQDLIIEQLATELIGFGDQLTPCVDGSPLRGTGRRLPVAQLSILDGQLVRMSGQERFLDLGTGEWQSSLSRAPLEIVCYDLTALYVLVSNKLTKVSSSEEV